MNVVGIIAEFNPFHEGHAYLIQKAKEETGSDLAVVIMNGDFVQRGEPAIFDKYRRTEAALKGGADMVLELPVRFGVSSAGDFALGGIMALSALGFVTHLAFGSECGELPPFLETSTILLKESEEFRKILSHCLRDGLSYPKARAHALEATARVSPEFLAQPNNILGIEYCLALKKLSSSLIPVTVARKGMGYHEIYHPDEERENIYPSATALRQHIHTENTPHLTLEDFDSAIGYALLENSSLTKYKDISPDLAGRIQGLLPDACSTEELITRCQTRAFTTGRIRRALIQCLLHVENTEPVMPYLRLLGLVDKKNGTGSLLSQVPGSCQILSRLAADTKNLDPEALTLFRQDLLASDLYRQTWCHKYNVHLPGEYQHSPIIIPFVPDECDSTIL